MRYSFNRHLPANQKWVFSTVTCCRGVCASLFNTKMNNTHQAVSSMKMPSLSSCMKSSPPAGEHMLLTWVTHIQHTHIPTICRGPSLLTSLEETSWRKRCLSSKSELKAFWQTNPQTQPDSFFVNHTGTSAVSWKVEVRNWATTCSTWFFCCFVSVYKRGCERQRCECMRQKQRDCACILSWV